uniref:Armadillo repeat-containing protein 1 n=1 Tax=Ditylenchus dipsaci TaxID=166011 RepID=A0A915ED85_9BILA
MLDPSMNKQEDLAGSVTNAIDATLLTILKTYYRLCRTSSEKQTLIEDSNLMRTLCDNAADKRPQVALYVCKILLALSRDQTNSSHLAESEELKKAIANACEVDYVSPQVVNGLLIVQSRILNADKNPSYGHAHTKANRNKLNKQYVFKFHHPNEMQKTFIEKSCLEVPGVISVCFQPSSYGLRCIVRCKETVDARDIANQILSGDDYDMVQLLVRLEDGSQQTLEFYRDEEEDDKKCLQKELPQYLDDNVECFDPSQCVLTKEQSEQQQQHGSSWFSLSALKFW